MKITYWVMYRETVPLQAGGSRTSDVQHFGTDNLETAQEAVERLRTDYIAKGTSILAYRATMHEAWIEAECRGRLAS